MRRVLNRLKTFSSFMIAAAIVIASLNVQLNNAPHAFSVGSLCTANGDSVNVAPYNTTITTTSNVFKPTGTHEFFISGRQYLIRQSGSILSFRMYVDTTSAHVTGLKLRIWHEGKIVTGGYPSFGSSSFVLVSQSENVASQITQGTAQTYTFTLNTPILAGEGDYFSVLMTTTTAAANVLSSVPIDVSERWAIESVNTTTDVLTITGHGLSDTNQIQVYNYNSGGLIGGLAQISGSSSNGQFYYVNKIDNNTFSLHTTSADSSNDVNRVDITSSGSGTTYKTSGYYKTRMYRYAGTGASFQYWRFPYSNNTEISQRAIPVDIKMQAPNVVMIGDSLTSGASNNTAYAYEDPGSHNAGADLSPERFAAPKYAIPGFLAQSGFTIQNMGINGNTSAQALARLTRDVINMKPRVAVIFIGTNDISQGVTVGDTSTSGSIVSNVNLMLSALQSNSIKGVVVSVLGANSLTTVRSQNADTLNTSLRSIVANYGGFAYVNARPYVNVFRSGGDSGNLWDINSSFTLSAESPSFLHLLPTGYQMVASAISNTLNNFICQPAPAASTFSPTDNATGVTTTSNLVITFDQAVQGGTGSIIIKKSSDDSTVETISANNTSLVSGSGTTTLTINPATTLSESTGYYVTLGANAIRNVGGRHYAGITSSSTWNFTTGDFTAPTATLSPLDNATGVSKTANLVLTFNEVVQGGTGTITIKKSSDDSTVETITSNDTTYVSGSGTTTITINPATSLTELAGYYVVISANAFRDAVNNKFSPITSATAWNFTIGDSTAPTISSLSPADNATGVATTADLVLTFDEAVQGGTGTIAIKKASDDSTVETISATGAQVTGSGTTSITINPATTLANSTNYYVIVSASALKDASGNYFAGITNASTWNFTTVAATAVSSSESSSSTTATHGGARGSTLFGKVSDAIARIMNRFNAATNDDASSENSSHSGAGSSASRSLSSRKGDLLTLTVDTRRVTYTDVPLDAWFSPYVATLVENGIAQGYREPSGELTGEFGVGEPVTFAEVIKMALESMNDSLVAKPPRNLSAQGTWSSPYIARAEQLKLSGLSTDLNVNNPATRGEVVHMILELLKLPIAGQISTFSDVPPNHPDSKAIETAKFYGIIKGDTAPDGSSLNTFRPDEHLNRAEVAKIIALLKEVQR